MKSLRQNLITTEEAAEYLNLKRASVNALCRKGIFKTAKKSAKGSWRLEREEVEKMVEWRLSHGKDRKSIHCFSEGTIGITEAANRLGISRARVFQFCQQGRIKAVKKGRYWEIYEDTLFDILPKQPRKYTRAEFHDQSKADDRNKKKRD